MIKILIAFCILITSVNLTDVSYYEVLGVTKQASAQEIRQAYKKLAVKLHPDKNPNSAEQEKFLKITEAYETLKDPDKRHKYDVYGSYPTYSRKYDYHSQSEYNNLYYNGLYHGDPFVDTLSGSSFYNYLKDGFYFINFYSPFCPPCQRLADDWKKLAEVYKGIVKVAAVNCKHHNSFCYNSMRIGSYPSLLFYPNGNRGNYVYYRNDHTLDALDSFVMSYIRSRVSIPTIWKLRATDIPMAYVLGENRIGKDALTRVTYHLNGLATVVMVLDDSLRSQLTTNDYTTIIFKYEDTSKEIESTDEKYIVKEIVEALPKIQVIIPEKFKEIRNQLRSGQKTPYVLYFSSKSDDRLIIHQMRISHPNLHFGEIDCDSWSELCASLHIDTPPSWGVLKPGGGYHRAPPKADPHTFVTSAIRATKLHTLSATDFTKILDGDIGMWVLLVVPYQLPWAHIADTFTESSLHFVDEENISFGIMTCSLSTDKTCRSIAHSQATILVQDGSRRHFYNGRVDKSQIVEFVQLLRDSADMDLNEQQVLEIMDASGREHSWLVAFLPKHCGNLCEQLMHQMRIVADKLRPLKFVRVGVLECQRDGGGFCANIRSPTARLYPLASGQHYSVSLQHLSEAPYILEWTLEHLDDSVQKLNWHSFTKTVIAEELNPTSKKPWLVYFHSPRCYRCYEMYSDFAIAGFFLHNAVHIGKVNCINERGLCQHEQITSYPSIRLYLNRNHRQTFSSVVTIQVRDYSKLLEDIKPYLLKYDDSLLAGVNKHVKHDEF